MATITLEIPEELSSQLNAACDRLPELLALSLQQPPLAAHIYRSFPIRSPVAETRRPATAASRAYLPLDPRLPR